MKDGDGSAMNLRAYVALGGASLDWRGDLAKLLRSEEPLDRLLRDRLADLIENQDGEGPSLRLHNVKPQLDRFKRGAALYQWMDIGRWISARRAQGRTREEAIWEASGLFNSSDKKCEQALGYFMRADEWVAGALSTPAGAAIGREGLEDLHHAMEADPTVRDLNRKLIESLTPSQ